MPLSQEIYLFPAAGEQHWLSRLRSLERRLAQLPAVSVLQPIVQRILAVAEPAGRVHLRSRPNDVSGHYSTTLTVVSANLWHDWPRHRKQQERIESFAQLAEKERADIILLQEVSRTPNFHMDGWLAERLNLGCIYSRANGHESAIGFEEGLAIFSRFPILDLHLKQLGSRSHPFVRRLGLGATLQTPFGNLLAVSVHLGLTRRQNRRQVSELREWTQSISGPGAAVIGGDFNAPERSAHILHTQRVWLDTFRHLHPDKDGATHELRWPWGSLLCRHRLDYIFLHCGSPSWRVVETRHLDSPAGPHSDHRAVLTRLSPL